MMNRVNGLGVVGLVVCAGGAGAALAGVDQDCGGCDGHAIPTMIAKPLCLLDGGASVPFGRGDVAPLTAEQMRQIAAQRGEPAAVVRSMARGGGGLEVVFNVFGVTNADTISAIQLTADYYAARINDDITVEFNVTFDPGFFGGAGPQTIDVPYADYVAALRSDADADDTIQDLLPNGSLPARRFFGGPVSQETTVTLTTANAKALGIDIGGFTGPDAELFVGSLPDGDPSDGIGNGSGQPEFFADFSLVDILVHEVGHSLGFINVIEFGFTTPTSLDTFRFARSGPDNPTDDASFTANPRALYVEGASVAEQHAFDFIVREHEASNASDFQASHFEETGAFPNRIGVMEPAIAPFETGFPEYFSQADFDAFDGIGWDIVAGGGPCSGADLASPFGELDIDDVLAFVDAFASGEPGADLAPPEGVLNIDDVLAFLNAFAAGCP